jgi:hypothetical protein
MVNDTHDPKDMFDANVVQGCVDDNLLWEGWESHVLPVAVVLQTGSPLIARPRTQ